MATAATTQALIDAVASEVCDGIQRALRAWMGQVELALDNPSLTTLGRLHAVRDVVERYRATNPTGTHFDGHAA